MSLKERFKAAAERAFGKYKWYKPFSDDYGFRTLVLAIGGAFINVVFACFNIATAIVYSSVWYGAFAGYYTILALCRIFVLIAYRTMKKRYGDDEQKLDTAKTKVYLVTGTILVPLDIALGVIVTMMVLSQRPINTNEIMAIATATYAFYKIIMAIRNMVKARKTRDALTQTVRNIGLVDALTSMLSLEATLIATFGTLTRDMITVIAVSGLVVCLFTVGLGSFMIIKAAKRLKLYPESDRAE